MRPDCSYVVGRVQNVFVTSYLDWDKGPTSQHESADMGRDRSGEHCYNLSFYYALPMTGVRRRFFHFFWVGPWHGIPVRRHPAHVMNMGLPRNMGIASSSIR